MACVVCCVEEVSFSDLFWDHCRLMYKPHTISGERNGLTKTTARKNAMQLSIPTDAMSTQVYSVRRGQKTARF